MVLSRARPPAPTPTKGSTVTITSACSGADDADDADHDRRPPRPTPERPPRERRGPQRERRREAADARRRRAAEASRCSPAGAPPSTTCRCPRAAPVRDGLLAARARGAARRDRARRRLARGTASRSRCTPGAGPARRRRRLPGPARPVRRGRHRAGAARDARRRLRRRRRGGVGGVHGQGALQGADGRAAACRRWTTAACAASATRADARTVLAEIARARACPCSSSPRTSARRSGSSRWAPASSSPAALEAAFAHDALVIVEAMSSGVEVECGVLGALGRARAGRRGGARVRSRRDRPRRRVVRLRGEVQRPAGWS